MPAYNEVRSDDFDGRAKARLTTWLSDQRRFGEEWPRVTKQIVEAARRGRSLTVLERADRLLGYLGSVSEFAGEKIALENPGGFTEMLILSESVQVEEVEFLLDYLTDQHFVEQDGDDNGAEVKVTVDGYGRLFELEQNAVDSKQAFVAMWFDDSMDEAFEKGIASGIREAGYEPLRIDRKEHNNKIDDEIIAEIRRSRFLVADFTEGRTGARGGVYYEAGFAHGLNIPVIFTCRADMIGKVHFDTRQYPHILWNTPEELRERLAQRVSATIGDGPLKTQS